MESIFEINESVVTETKAVFTVVVPTDISHIEVWKAFKIIQVQTSSLNLSYTYGMSHKCTILPLVARTEILTSHWFAQSKA